VDKRTCVYCKSLMRRVSTVVVQQFCKLLVGGSNPSPGTNFQGLRKASSALWALNFGPLQDRRRTENPRFVLLQLSTLSVLFSIDPIYS
jgi:hypothetical protein